MNKIKHNYIGYSILLINIATFILTFLPISLSARYIPFFSAQVIYNIFALSSLGSIEEDDTDFFDIAIIVFFNMVIISLFRVIISLFL